MLDGLPEDVRTAFITRARRRRFAGGEVVFHDGDPAGSVHLIQRGHVAVRRWTRLGDVVTLTVLGSGEVFGELGVIAADGRRAASVVALGRTETLSWDRHDLTALRTAHPSVDAALVEQLSAQIRQLTAHLMEALFESAEMRVLRRLLAVAEVYGGAANGTEIPLTQDDLASMAGTTRPTANRALQGLRDGEVVALKRGHITILDPHELARRAR